MPTFHPTLEHMAWLGVPQLQGDAPAFQAMLGHIAKILHLYRMWTWQPGIICWKGQSSRLQLGVSKMTVWDLLYIVCSMTLVYRFVSPSYMSCPKPTVPLMAVWSPVPAQSWKMKVIGNMKARCPRVPIFLKATSNFIGRFRCRDALVQVGLSKNTGIPKPRGWSWCFPLKQPLVGEKS